MNAAIKPRAIHLHIDSLSLRGFDHLDPAALTAALHEALQRELLVMPVPGGDVQPRLHTALTLPAPCSAEQLGSGLARSLAAIVGGHHAPTPRHADAAHGERHG